MKFSDILLILNLFFFISISAYIIYQLNGDSWKCLASPLNYGVEKNQEMSNSSFYCKCYFSDPRYLPILVTHNSTSPLELPKLDIYKPLNLSDVNFFKN